MGNQKINYQKLCEEEISKASAGERVPSVLLHSCCAPCSSYCIEYLSQYFHVTVFYYNPNIYPDSEYYHRVKEQQEFINRFPAKYPVGFIEGDFDTQEFYKAAKGLEQEPERGARCTECFRLRLGRTAEVASEKRFDYFTSTLTISPMKDAALLNQIGSEMGEVHGVKWLPSDFKKKNGYLRSCELSREYGIYRQDYCGCVFSYNERQKEKESFKEAL
jgi:predicted adenine nucleotide alpha hydrolase (AANH) superfamily ATPase